jgi:hypothetical protein
MTIEELYSQTNLNEHVDALPEYMQGALKYGKSYKIRVFDVHFKAVKFDKRNNVILYYLQDFSHIPERYIAKALKYKGVDTDKYLEEYDAIYRSVRNINIKDLTPKRAQNIIDKNVVFFRQIKEREERQNLINLVNNL